MGRSWVRFLALLASLVLALAAAGCGGDDDDEGAAGTTTAAEGKTGGTLVFAGASDPVVLDGALVSDGESLRVITQIFETLVALKPGTTEPVAGLAESWDMSADAKVRPDGRIALPLINEVQAAGLTPEQLHKKLTEESKKYMEDANITVVVREINSRKAFITGEVNKPGPYPLTAPTTVMQLISMAGGLREYADAKKIMIMRSEGGRQTSLPFNYKEVAGGKNLQQNIELKPGDTVVVP